MKKLDFYIVNNDYVKFLQKSEIDKRRLTRVPNNDYEKNNQKPKFFCGVVLNVRGKNYYVPVSSFNKQKPDNFLIYANNGKVTSSLRFNYMFPIPKELIIQRTISNEPDVEYRRLLMQELRYCIENQDRIYYLAERTYNRVLLGKDVGLLKNSCDFLFLEEQCLEYCKLHNLTQSLEAYKSKNGNKEPIRNELILDNCHFMEVNISDLKKLDGLNYEKRINKKNPEKAIIAIDKTEIEVFKNALKPRSNNNGIIR